MKLPSLKLSRLLALPFFFFFNDTATTEIYTLSLHDALPIYGQRHREQERVEHGTMEVDVEGEDADHQQQGHFQEEVAEAPNPALEIGLGRAQLQAIRNGPELGVPSDRDHQGRGGARDHRGAHEDSIY